MTEEVAGEINTKTVSNGDSPTVSDDILQNMRRGLFGKSAGSQEGAPVNASSTTQEHSNGSVDTDDPMKNGISFEDKEELSQKHQQAEETTMDQSPVVEEVPPETETTSDGESDAVIIEEPKDGSVKSVNSPGNPLLDPEGADDIEITEVGSVDNATPHETFTVPVVIQSSSASPRNIEVSEESVEVPITESDAMETAPVDEEAQPTQDEAKLDEDETPADDGADKSTATEEETKKDTEQQEMTEKMEAEEQPEKPKSGRRSKKSVKEDEPDETPTKMTRSRRGAVKEEETPSRRSLRGNQTKDEEETGEEEQNKEEEEDKEVPVEEKKTPARKTPRRGQKVEEEKEEENKDEEEQEKVSEDEEPPASTKRGNRALKGKAKAPAKKKEEKPKEEEEVKEEETKDEEEEKEEEVPVTRRSTRRGRVESKGPSEKSEDDEAVAETPKRATRRGQVKKPAEEPEKKEEQVEEKTPSRATRRSTRETPRGKKVEVEKEEKEEEEEEEDKEEEDYEEEEPVPEKRARRGAKTEIATPKSAGRASARRGAQKKVAKEEDEEEEDDGKKSKTTGKKGKVEKKSEEFDPYDVDTQLDLHPDPLKNVVLSGGLFGTHKYGKIGSGKYTFTEKAAEERIGNLGDLLPKQVNRRSLADLTPGRRRNPPKGTKSAPPARKKKDVESDEEMDVDQPGSSKATPTTSRKRKTSADGGATAKKAALEMELPSLNDEEQWFADHPPDEHAPIQIGARVYAVFSKIYYPAVIVAERDGLGRYKVQFVEDNVVRDIPAQGIVPLRAVVAEKECYYEDDSAVIIACPNAASSKEWAAAVFTIRRLDAQGEVTGNDVKCGWSKLSLDMNDWKDYIHQKSIEATSVATDNIAHTRTRRSHVEPPAPASSMTAVPSKSPKKGAKKTTKGRTNVKGGDETEATEEEHDRNIFSGMVFLLTSAQRDGNSSFKKKMLVDCIVERQGTVVEDFNEMDQHPDCRHFLISDTYYRTHKYLAALAKGVPCISHEWIHKCIETESVVDNSEYILPAGKSSINDDEYPAPRQNSRILSGKNILIYSGNQLSNPKAINYYQIWEPLVSYMGGRPFKGLNDIGPEDKLDIVLTDNSVTDAMLRRAAKDEAWVVTSEWLINVIIMDRLVDPDSFPRFKVQKAAQMADEE